MGSTVIILDVGGFFGPKKIILNIRIPAKLYDSAKYVYTYSKKTMLLTLKVENSFTVNINGAVSSIIFNDSIPSHSLVNYSLTSVISSYDINTVFH